MPKKPLNALGGAKLEVEYKDGRKETVTVREATVREVLDDTYFRLYTEDYPALLDYLCTKAPADKADGSWSNSLTRKSFKALRELEEQLNFTFALEETQAALSRGKQTEFIREAAQKLAMDALARITKVTGPLAPSPASSLDIAVPQEAGVHKL